MFVSEEKPCIKYIKIFNIICIKVNKIHYVFLEKLIHQSFQELRI
jgi:hypothetical protein